MDGEMKDSEDPTALTWYVSTYTGGQGNCVEVANLAAGARAVRDTKHRASGHLSFTGGEWTGLLSTLKKLQP
ncbi:DUF397 domain-containing protein [Nocardiopsis sp. NPDC058631]|uniref:DUF397 domain-containing protein n=1 Tax=Nocardiopsis sp. NPDC058631 TaxID=3346566 RepID=UPI00365686D7